MFTSASSSPIRVNIARFLRAVARPALLGHPTGADGPASGRGSLSVHYPSKAMEAGFVSNFLPNRAQNATAASRATKAMVPSTVG